MQSILLVEDDPDMTNLINLHFHERLFRLTTCSNGEEASEKVSMATFDLIMLDVTLPDINGMDLCKNLRQNNVNTPIMMLTCRNEETDKVLALERGANDYITKPFGISDLTTRIQSLLRKKDEKPAIAAPEKKEMIFKDLLIDFDKRRAVIRGTPLKLTNKEFHMLALLASHPGKTFSRNELLIQTFGVAVNGLEHTITSCMNSLRFKIELDFHRPQYIFATWGKGYRFQDEN